MRFALAVAALLLVGCDPRKGDFAVTEVALPLFVTEIASTSPAPKPDITTPVEADEPQVSSDCTCGPECPCRARSGGECKCDAGLQKRIEELPVQSTATSEELVVKEAGPKLFDPAKYDAIVANEVKCWDVLIEVPHPSQGNCPHCHRWLEPLKGEKTCPNYEIQKAGYTVGVLHDPVWGDTEPLPRIWVRGRLVASGYVEARHILAMLPPKATAPPSSGVTVLQGVPVVRMIVGESKAGGVVVGPNEVLTCSHVVHAGWPHTVEINGEVYPVTVLHDDPEHDLALVKYDGPAVPSIAVARSEPAEGTPATAYGFPAGGAQMKHATTVSRRWNGFSAVGLYHSRHPFVPGDSGGPVVNAAGELIGIVTGTDTRLRVGLVVDQPSIVAFLDSRVANRTSQTTSRTEGSFEATTQLDDAAHDVSASSSSDTGA